MLRTLFTIRFITYQTEVKVAIWWFKHLVHVWIYLFWLFLLLAKDTVFSHGVAAAANSLQLCLTLCDPIDGSSPGSPIPGILKARTQEWVAISFSNAWKWKVKVKSLSRVWLLATPWTAAYQAPPSMGLSRKEYWSGLPLPSLFSPLCFLIYLITCQTVYKTQQTLKQIMFTLEMRRFLFWSVY